MTIFERHFVGMDASDTSSCSAVGFDARAMAKAVMVPNERVRPINSNNEWNGEWISLEAAISRGTAFMVNLREGVVAWDADPEDDETAVPAWVASMQRVAHEIGGSFVLVGSGRSGHHHAYVVGAPGWSSADLKARLLEEPDIPAGQQRADRPIRPPLSPHRSGGAGALVEPRDFTQALAALTGRPGLIDFSEESRRILRHGDPEGRFTRGGSRSRTSMAQSLALRYVNADIDAATFAREMLEPGNNGGEKAQELRRTRGLREARGRCHEWYEEARVRARENPAWGHGRRRRRDDVELLHRTVLTHPWPPGKAGTTDRLLFEYLVSVADCIENPVVQHSIRSIADGIGREKKTVMASLQRLHRAGLLSTISRGTRSQARTYELHPRVHRNGPSTHLLPPSPRGIWSVWVQSGLAGEVHDVFRGGLPAPAMRTLRSMPTGEVLSVAALQALLPGVSRTSIRRHLAALHSAGLVDADQLRPLGLWRRLPGSVANLDELADQLGTAGETARRRARTEVEREEWSLRAGHDRQRSRPVHVLHPQPRTNGAPSRAVKPASAAGKDLRIPG
jgi:DNA-binding transcriptional ArsR family regulator